MGMQYLTPRPSAVVLKKTGAAQTILRAICFVIFFLHTCDEWIFSKSRVPLCYPTRFRENREKRNPYDWRTQVHHRWCARLADSLFSGTWRAVLRVTDIHWRVKFNLVGSEIKLAYRIWTTYLLLSPIPSLPPVNRGALRCVADPL